MIGTTVVALLLLLALSVPVAVGVGVLGLVLDELFAPLPLYRALGEVTWSASTDFLLVAIPLFVLLGEILLRSGLAERMYAAMVQWLSWLPGGLMHSNIASSAMFAAISGSSVATAATIGTVAIGEIDKRGYNERFFLGTLAAGGTLGILIPPSINMIVYGVLTQTSIPQLYLAGIVPGIVLTVLFMATVLVGCLIRPKWGGRRVQTNWASRIAALPDLLPPLVIFAVVIGSIYAGLATATESAALGVLAAFALAGMRRRLTWPVLREIVEGTMKTTGMIMAILVGAYFLNFVLIAIGLARKVSDTIAHLGWSPGETLLAVIVFYVILGMFMETLSMMVATIPLVTPIMVGMGYDPVWFGVLIILLIETALITPPVGLNLYVVQGVRPRGPMADVIVGSLPFVVTLFVMIGLLAFFPGLALWIPQSAMR